MSELISLGISHKTAPVEQRLCRPAVAARFRGVDRDSITHFTKDSARFPGGNPVAGSLKTEAIVLRSMRYGEADRILMGLSCIILVVAVTAG